jgi:KRAB domain-containing zinc finger protein
MSRKASSSISPNTVSGRYPGLCPQCGKEFRNLASHVKTAHLGQASSHLAAECGICRRRFTQKVHLKEHIRSVHQQVKQFRCSFCCREFYRKPNFRRHMRAVHMQRDLAVPRERVACVDCLKVFRSKNALAKHRRNIHLGLRETTRRFYCEECGQSFTQSGSLYSHVRKVHGREPDLPRNGTSRDQQRVRLDPARIFEAHPELKVDLA